jgi:hypothetical protein
MLNLLKKDLFVEGLGFFDMEIMIGLLWVVWFCMEIQGVFN